MNDYEARQVAAHLGTIAKAMETANMIAWREATGDTSKDATIGARLHMEVPEVPESTVYVW